VGSSNFRPSTIADKAAIAELSRELLGLTPDHPMAESSHMHWKYWEPHPGWTGSRSYVFLRDDQIAAHGAIIPHVCLWQGHRITALHVIDWAATPRFTGSGVALMKQISKSIDLIFAVGGSEFTQQILPMVGFKESGTIVAAYARPVRPLLRLVSADYKNWRLAPQVIRAAFWALTARSRHNIEWSAHRVSADQVAAASIVWPTPKSDMAVFWRPPQLRRYLFLCPATTMEL
jgi:hypothetical protein